MLIILFHAVIETYLENFCFVKLDETINKFYL